MSKRRQAPYVVEAAEEFLRLKLPRAPKTWASYSAILIGSERGTKPSLGIPLSSYFYNRRFNSVTEDEVAAWFAQRVSGGAQATKHRISKGARAFLRFAHDRGYTTRSLATAIEPYVAGTPRVDWLQWEQVHQLIATIDEFRYEMAAAWLFWTGCRVSEATGGRQQDLQFQAKAGTFTWEIPKSKTHKARTVWLPDELTGYVLKSRALMKRAPSWPILWDCEGRGFGRVENPAVPISARTINAVLERSRDAIELQIPVTAHIARHSYCTNWIQEFGSNELAMEKLSRQVGSSVTVLRQTYVHVDLTESDWGQIKGFGARSFA